MAEIRQPDVMREALRRIREDPDGLPADIPAPLHPDGWLLDDVPAWRAANAKSILQRVPAPFRAARLSDCPPVMAWAKRHRDDPWHHPWVRLHGGTGRGKTFCAWALTKWKVMHAATLGQGLSWRFVTNPELNDELRPKPDQSHVGAADKYLRAEWLVIDDLGAGNLTEFAIENTLRILNYRFDQRLPGAYTSNLGIGDLAALFGDRIASRIERATPIIFDGPDRRLRQEGDPT